MNRPGIRFTVTRHNPPEDIEAFLLAMDSTFEEVRSEIRHSHVVELADVSSDASLEHVG
jgi:hypothetical protein